MFSNLVLGTFRMDRHLASSEGCWTPSYSLYKQFLFKKKYYRILQNVSLLPVRSVSSSNFYSFKPSQPGSARISALVAYTRYSLAQMWSRYSILRYILRQPRIKRRDNVNSFSSVWNSARWISLDILRGGHRHAGFRESCLVMPTKHPRCKLLAVMEILRGGTYGGIISGRDEQLINHWRFKAVVYPNSNWNQLRINLPKRPRMGYSNCKSNWCDGTFGNFACKPDCSGTKGLSAPQVILFYFFITNLNQFGTTYFFLNSF